MNSLQFRNDSKHWDGPPAAVSRGQINNPDPPVYSFTATRATPAEAIIRFEAKNENKVDRGRRILRLSRRVVLCQKKK
jgi:hypothetical protein